MKGERVIADFHFIAIPQRLWRFHELAVYQGAVAAVQVFDHVLAVHERNLRMLPADGALIQHDVAFWMTTQDGAVARQFEPLTSAIAVQMFQEGHINQQQSLDRNREGVYNAVRPPESAAKTIRPTPNCSVCSDFTRALPVASTADDNCPSWILLTDPQGHLTLKSKSWGIV